MSENHYAEFSECSMKPQEVLEYVSGPIPVPEEGEVLVRMKAAPINPADINFVQGVYGLKPVLPHSPRRPGRLRRGTGISRRGIPRGR